MFDLHIGTFDNRKVPTQYRNHPQVVSQVFYILPQALLSELTKSCGTDAFDADALGLEQSLSRELQHNPRFVGFDERGEAFSHTLLPWKDLPLPEPTDSLLKQMERSRESYNRFLDEAAKRIAPHRNALRGYLGWLLTNLDYLRERDDLFAKWNKQIAADGIPQSGPTFFGKVPHNKFIKHVTSRRTNSYLVDFARFYARWRLQHLITRELPEPLAPQAPIAAPLALLTHMQAGGVSFYQPDTIPVATPDLLRGMLDDLRVHGQNDHLAEWIGEFSDTGTTAHSINKFSQILNLHFYWRLLEERHPSLFDRRVGKITAAFGEYLGVGLRAMEIARATIVDRLQSS